MEQRNDDAGNSDSAPGDAIWLTGRVWVRRGDVRLVFSRASGPGGQAVNKLNTRAQLRVALADLRNLNDIERARLRREAGHRLTDADEIVVQAQTHRSQLDNRRACFDRLRSMVEEACRPRQTRRPTRPTKGSVQRRLDSKRRRSDKKRDRGWRDQ